MKTIVTGGEVSRREREAYEARAREKYGDHVDILGIALDGEEAVLSYHLRQPPFERVRRITGYLTGTLDKWNSAKRAEERDRVKHPV